MKTGSADLPLHGGHCPRWLFETMTTLGAAIVEAILIEHSREEVLRRLSDPGWFQAFGCTLGFDWHSSGLTTVVCGALKEALNPRAHEWGIYVAGGKGSASRRTPHELAEYAEQNAPSLPVEDLQKQSRRAAQVDTSGLQDGYPIYHHSFVVTSGGQWTVIQQGLNEDSGWARRYHWLGKKLTRFWIKTTPGSAPLTGSGRSISSIRTVGQTAIFVWISPGKNRWKPFRSTREFWTAGTRIAPILNYRNATTFPGWTPFRGP